MRAKKRASGKVKKEARSAYLEVYIKNDGETVFTPLTSRTVSVAKEIFSKKKQLYGVYCG